MSALIINGIVAPIDAKLSYDAMRVGDFGEAQSGRPLETIRRWRDKYSGTITFAIRTEAQAWRSMLRGLGHGWSFATSTYSDFKGLGIALSGVGAAVRQTGGKYGTGQMMVAYECSCSYTIEMVTPGTVSISVWDKNGAGVTWQHWVGVGTVDASGAITISTWYLNGFAHGGPAWFVGTGAGAGTACFGLTGGTGSDNLFSDLLILPYAMPSTWPKRIYDYGSAYPKPPLLSATGDVIHDGGTLVCRGTVASTSIENRGTLDALERVPFILTED